uniref:Putative ovule protein n=1 Tax=Solanum chacoense TaxID=4108 RepID=A0A0V0IJN3_SOLCH
MTTCIILHNMIIEDERDLNAPIQDAVEAPTPTIEMVIDENLRFEQFLARHKKIKDKNAHFELRNALIEHLWEQRNNLKIECLCNVYHFIEFVPNLCIILYFLQFMLFRILE